MTRFEQAASVPPTVINGHTITIEYRNRHRRADDEETGYVVRIFDPTGMPCDETMPFRFLKSAKRWIEQEAPNHLA
jgi:hypothetical protein